MLGPYALHQLGPVKDHGSGAEAEMRDQVSSVDIRLSLKLHLQLRIVI